jgi:arylsulfatase A-like enzyme
VRYDAPWMEHEDRAALSEGWAAPWVDLHSTGNEALRLNRKATGEEHSLILSVASGERTLTEPQMEQLRDTYRSEIWATDQRLGRLLDSWAVHTGGEGIVLITSDHGEHFGELGLLDHGHVLNGINTRVPLMIQAPGAPPRRVVEPVSHLEVADTLRTLVGINAGSEGLVPRMQGEESDRVPILARTWPDPLWARTLGGDFDSGQRLVRFGDWALVALDNGKRSLYRVSADPLMLHDLSESHGKVVEELARLLGQMDSKDQATAPMPPSEDMLRALEELGYLEP